MWCEGPIWIDEDLAKCYLHTYFQVVPIVVILAVSIAVVAVSLLLSKKKEDLTEEFSDGEEEIAIVPRSTRDRLLLAAEAAGAAFIAFLAVLANVQTSISWEWREDSAVNGISVLTALWVYNFILVAVRWVFPNLNERLGLWYHSTVIYSFMALFHTAYIWSAINHPYSNASRNFYIASTATVWVLAMLTWLSKSKSRRYIREYRTRGVEKPFPVDSSSLVSKFLFLWVNPMVRAGSEKTLTIDDVWDIAEEDHALHIVQGAKKKITTRRALLGAIFRVVRPYFLWLTLFATLRASFVYAPPLFINRILKYIEQSYDHEQLTTGSGKTAWLYVLGILVFSIASNLANCQALYLGLRITVNARSMLISMIYEKALRRKAVLVKEEASGAIDGEENNRTDDEHEDENSVGSIINLMSVDSYKLADFFIILHLIVTNFLEALFALGALYFILGKSAFAGTLAMVFFMPLNYWFSSKYARLQGEIMKVSDKRVHKTNELLSAIKMLKYFGWENQLADGVRKERTKEVELLYRQIFHFGCGVVIWVSTIVVVSAATFASYSFLEGKTLTSPVAFTALALFDLLQRPLDSMAEMLTDTLEAKVSADRISAFLNQPDTKKFDNPIASSAKQVAFENATLAWSGGHKSFKLSNISVEFPQGKLSVVIGPTGSGKSSLLLALLGEMDLESGSYCLPGGQVDRTVAALDLRTGLGETVAYCSQQAWLINGSIRENILFMSSYDQERYHHVLYACCLIPDLDIFEKGDSTLVGEKGIILSGGQKQRISLARAMYSRSKVLLLDDCLSAVDAGTGSHIYDNCLTGELTKNRTVILVSHNKALATSKADYVVAMKAGKVEAQGSPQDVVVGHHLSTCSSSTSVNGGTDSDSDDTTVQPSEFKPPKAVAVSDEEAEELHSTGKVSREVYLRYFSLMYSKKMWAVVAASFVIEHFFRNYQNIWLRTWTVFGQFSSHSTLYYLLIYFSIGTGGFVTSYVEVVLAMSAGIHATKKLFDQLLDTVISAKARFYDTTPIGQIMNRFSKDIETLDQDMPMEQEGVYHFTISALISVGFVAFVSPQFLIVAAAMALIYGHYLKVYLAATRELKRIDSMTRSPIFQHFGETLTGIVTIRAYGASNEFLNGNHKRLDTNQRPYFYRNSVNHWLQCHTGLVNSSVAVGAAFLVVMKAGSIDAGLAGLSLTYALNFSEQIMLAIRIYGDFEIQMNSVERVMEYLDHIPQEELSGGNPLPSPHWPDHGRIEFKELCLRYADDTPLVLKQVSCTINPGEKVGVVGRTGAGKSTLISALFRFLVPVSGSIEIDGVDIATLNLLELRRALAIIPQDPTLFTGTLQSNLDPFNSYNAEELGEALQKVHFWETVHHGDRSLSYAISEGGSNLSQGQRQLVCLARAFLKGPKVLLLDEATASIDHETDAKIQQSLREEDPTTTTIVIAHRLATVIDFDKVLVLQEGRVAEYGRPADLIQSGGLFDSMCRATGEYEKLVSLTL
ncbi:ATP-dependent bile acid permease [Trichomonascus vanleenenianus]|uniref:ATP-dependent bile acid permease n=1 Tax=Trichomonascus vanleenenianus TaxID=2268995 RepID=UPI003ECA4DC8